jgi:hypothetical protein
MAQTYYVHNKFPEVRIKVTKKTVTWEENRIMNHNAVIDGAPEERAWKYKMRHSLPVNNAETLREMYSLPDDVVARLKGEQA